MTTAVTLSSPLVMDGTCTPCVLTNVRSTGRPFGGAVKPLEQPAAAISIAAHIEQVRRIAGLLLARTWVSRGAQACERGPRPCVNHYATARGRNAMVLGPAFHVVRNLSGRPLRVLAYGEGEHHHAIEDEDAYFGRNVRGPRALHHDITHDPDEVHHRVEVRDPLRPRRHASERREEPAHQEVDEHEEERDEHRLLLRAGNGRHPEADAQRGNEIDG